jgi:hypothetical protein
MNCTLMVCYVLLSHVTKYPRNSVWYRTPGTGLQSCDVGRVKTLLGQASSANKGKSPRICLTGIWCPAARVEVCKHHSTIRMYARAHTCKHIQYMYIAYMHSAGPGFKSVLTAQLSGLEILSDFLNFVGKHWNSNVSYLIKYRPMSALAKQKSLYDYSWANLCS